MSRPAGYTRVVKVDKTVYIAGQVSVGTDGTVVGKGDPEAQVRQIWRNLEAAVQSVGGTLHHIVKTTTYITSTRRQKSVGGLSAANAMILADSTDEPFAVRSTSPEYMGAVRKVRDEVHQGSNPPISTLLVVSALANPDFMVEIEAIAVVE